MESLRRLAGIFRDWKRILPLLVVPFTLDFIFIVLYLFTDRFFENLIADVILSFKEGINRGLVAQSSSMLDFILSSPGMRDALWKIFYLVLLNFLVVVFIYLILQSAAWWKSLVIVHGKMGKVRRYIFRFAGLSLIWAIIIFFLNLLSFMVSIINSGEQTPLGWGISLFILLIVYLAFISYNMIPKHGSWKAFKMSLSIGFRKPDAIISFVIAFLFVFILSKIVSLITFFNLRLLLEIFIVISAISLMRVYFIEVVSNLQ